MLAQRGDIAQAQVHALPGQRMHHVRGIAQQEHAPGDMGVRQLPSQRERRARGLQLERPEFTAECGCQRAVEFARIGIAQALCFRVRQGPHDGRQPAMQFRIGIVIERQQRHRPARQETLPAGVAMRPLAGDERDQTLLSIVMAAGADAGQRAQRGLAAIRGDRESRIQHQAVVEADAHAGVFLLQRLDARRAMQAHARGGQQAPQRIDQRVVLDDPAQLRLAEAVGVEGQRIAAGGIPDLHPPIRLRARGQHAGPCAEVREQRRVVGRKGIDAEVAHLAPPSRRLPRLHQRDLQAFARQHQCGCGTDHAAAGDHHVQRAAPTHAAALRHSAGTSPR